MRIDKAGIGRNGRVPAGCAAGDAGYGIPDIHLAGDAATGPDDTRLAGAGFDNTAGMHRDNHVSHYQEQTAGGSLVSREQASML